MRTNYFFIFLVLMIATSCESNIKRIIKHQDEIIELSRNKVISNSHYRDYYHLTTYTNDNKMRNEYFFRKQEKEEKIFYTLFRDSIQFNPDTIINIDKEQDNYQENICNYYQRVTQILESYGMSSLAGDRYKNSPIATIYLFKGGILIYHPSGNVIGNKDYEYFKKVGDDWFLLKRGTQ